MDLVFNNYTIIHFLVCYKFQKRKEMKKEFKKLLRDKTKFTYDEIRNRHIEIFRHLIELMDDEDFERRFKDYFFTDPNEEMEEMEDGYLHKEGYNSIEEGFIDFHKSMRQIDFYKIGEGHLDMVFYDFIHISDVPFEMIKEFVEKTKKEKNEKD
jgi:hypothetical protein